MVNSEQHNTFYYKKESILSGAWQKAPLVFLYLMKVFIKTILLNKETFELKKMRDILLNLLNNQIYWFCEKTNI